MTFTQNSAEISIFTYSVYLVGCQNIGINVSGVTPWWRKVLFWLDSYNPPNGSVPLVGMVGHPRFCPRTFIDVTRCYYWLAIIA